ncbi:MAG TPA: hypothetical protein DCQ92_16645 [Verrucomicrobia subdivision 3 bacterium]|nr:hypothetical protein [Limisphaerales bacterium]
MSGGVDSSATAALLLESDDNTAPANAIKCSRNRLARPPMTWIQFANTRQNFVAVAGSGSETVWGSVVRVRDWFVVQ